MECRIGQPHGQPSIFLHSLSSPTITNSSSVSTSSFDTAEAEPAEALLPWRASCARVCPTVTYFIINLVWMSTGIAGIALGNFVNKRYFSILLVSVFGLMVAVIYRFLYDLEHMDTMPNQPTVVSYPPTPTSRRSLPPCYSSVIALLGSVASFVGFSAAVSRDHHFSRQTGPSNHFYHSPQLQRVHVHPKALADDATDPIPTLEPFYPPQPYQFGFDTIDEYGTKMTRHEESDEHNRKKGSYSFTDPHGITRRVDYVADEHGFRATINTDEPGTAPSHPASAIINSPASPPPALEASASYKSPVVYTRRGPIYREASYHVANERHRPYRHS
ncbi:uncharacterized protein LOC111263670 isoform X2 [Varroa jacobsoni]|uniref:uncharacterized protein LOC111263670 isoform X2 n=1 Tax=Varroa jacobsoni TaxID=62625 RepID=UPI000BF2D654|nr:uncharacterized protein LOC111263670 isoform X2 [Varroa jacobsoni]